VNGTNDDGTTNAKAHLVCKDLLYEDTTDMVVSILNFAMLYYA